MVEVLAVVSGLAWMMMLLRARHLAESGKPLSQPGSRDVGALRKGAAAMGAFFGGLAGASLGTFLEVILAAVALLAVSLILGPSRKPLRSGKIEDRRIAGPDDEAEAERDGLPWE